MWERVIELISLSIMLLIWLNRIFEDLFFALNIQFFIDFIEVMEEVNGFSMLLGGTREEYSVLLFLPRLSNS
jgi:hypothetical protein